MKNKLLIIILSISVLIICFLLTFIPHKIVNIVPEDVSSIHIFNGRNGKYITITDKDAINHIISNLNSVTFQEDEPSMFRMGYGFKITI